LHNNRSTAAAPDPAHQSAASSSVSSHGASHSLAKAAAAGTASNGNSPSSSSSSSLAQASYERLARLSSAVNRLTGYESIDKLKGSVGSANQQLQDVKGALAAAKAEYDECLARQTQLHRLAQFDSRLFGVSQQRRCLVYRLSAVGVRALVDNRRGFIGRVHQVLSIQV
jgi:hypothetical protein